MNCNRLRGSGHADKVAARGAHAAFVGSVGQLVLQIRGLLRTGDLCCLCMHRVLMPITGSIRMVTMGFRLGGRLNNRMLRAIATVLHRCRSKALHGQSQHHEPEQERAKTRHRVLIL